mgnify:CR=1 FL=1
MKTYPVTVTMAFSIEASSEDTAQERAETVVDALVSSKLPKPLQKWWPDLEAPDIEVEEGED